MLNLFLFHCQSQNERMNPVQAITSPSINQVKLAQEYSYENLSKNVLYSLISVHCTIPAKMKNMIVRRNRGMSSSMANRTFKIFGVFLNKLFSNPESKINFSFRRNSFICGTFSKAAQMSYSFSHLISKNPLTGIFFHIHTVMNSTNKTRKTAVCNTTQQPGANEISNQTFISMVLILKGVIFNPPAERNAQSISRTSELVIMMKLTHPR